LRAGVKLFLKSPPPAKERDMYRQTVYFRGLDAGSSYNLWETNGTPAGTVEVGGIHNSGVSGVNSLGLFPTYITVLHGEVIFAGFDAAGNNSLWLSNGTTAGTSELTGISGASTDLQPTTLTALNGEVLFMGVDASGFTGLWATNGTAAGTSEVGGIGNSGVSGSNFGAFVFDNAMTFNSEVLFEGEDTNSFLGLWVTNGSPAGTTEVGGIGNSGVNGANAGGLFNDFANPQFAVFNSEVLFAGDGTTGGIGLWVTNGTAAGTSELAGISGTESTGSGLDPMGMTALNGEALFAGTDASGLIGLWVTNGTASGTSEVGGIGSSGVNDAFSGGLCFNDPPFSSPIAFTVLNGEALFDGVDGVGYRGLWVTNGMAAGTFELTGISGANTGSIFDPGRIPDFTVFNGEVLFNGYDTSGHVGLWVTNGTAAGTLEVGDLLNHGVGGASSGGLDPTFLTDGLRIIPPLDNFNSNNTSDILFRDGASGDTWFEAVSNGAFNGWNQIGSSNTLYGVTGTGDFFGTGTTDILYRDASTGDTWFEAMSNGHFAGWNQIGGSDTHYSVAGVGDFYGAGTDDILFLNTSSGDTWFEAMSNGRFAGWSQIGGSDTHYSAVGLGDFYGGGADDIVFRNISTGDTWIEQITNGAFAGWHQIGGSDTHYSVVGVGDFFGNGTDDILFRNNSTGDTWFEAISNGTFAGWHQIGGSDTTYSVVGVGDYFGTNASDILFRNISTGDTWFEAISNGAFAGWNQIGGSNTTYAVPLTVGPPALT
jgi:ELWxxDGT repeat protein